MPFTVPKLINRLRIAPVDEGVKECEDMLPINLSYWVWNELFHKQFWESPWNFVKNVHENLNIPRIWRLTLMPKIYEMVGLG